MTTTVDRPRVRPGAHALRQPSPLTQLPDALLLVTGKSRVVMLPPKWAGEPITVCECKGLLVYVRGAYRHSDTCLSCHAAPADAAPCTERHYGCSQPEFVECVHSCGSPVAISDKCARDRAARSCCNCCWNLDDITDEHLR